MKSFGDLFHNNVTEHNATEVYAVSEDGKFYVFFTIMKNKQLLPSPQKHRRLTKLLPNIHEKDLNFLSALKKMTPNSQNFNIISLPTSLSPQRNT